MPKESSPTRGFTSSSSLATWRLIALVVGIVASGPENPAERIARFRSDPAGTAERGEVRVLASPRFERVQWE